MQIQRIFPAISLAVLVALAPDLRAGDGADVIVSRIDAGGSSFGSVDVTGQGEFVSAFSIGTTSCNVGGINLDWLASPGSNRHPVISQSAYRLFDGRFEQIGRSWLKHGFLVINDDTCGAGCQTSDIGPTLFIGCSDLYTAALNGTRERMGPTFEVNAHTGSFPARHTLSNVLSAISSRLQIHNADIDGSLNDGALYFVQAHYVHPQDAAWGNGDNNASFATARFTRPDPINQPQRYNILVGGTTEIERSVIRAWKDNDPEVVETDARVPGEGLFILAARATDLNNGFHRYEYALQNLNSDRGGASFRVPLPTGVVLQNIGFHDVEYHSGDGLVCVDCVCDGGSFSGLPCEDQADCAGALAGDCLGERLNFDGTDWAATVDDDSITWATTPFSIDPNANALRWSTIYNFRFDANVGPMQNALVELGLFKPGFPSEIAIRTTAPELTFIDCNKNGEPDVCDTSCNRIGCGLSCGGSADCNLDAVPDECQADCNHNGVNDECDIRDGTSPDCNGNGVPDECEPDCDGDGIIDECELVLDCDADGVLDCDDLCLCTTPFGGCLPPVNQLSSCCYFGSGILVEGVLTWGECLVTGGVPVCGNPPTCPGVACPQTRCRDGCLVGDFDRDGDYDLYDAGAFSNCHSGPVESPAFSPPTAECLLRFDFDDDGDTDRDDFHEFSPLLAGPRESP